jgi:thiamine biosynthesis protein ThiS
MRVVVNGDEVEVEMAAAEAGGGPPTLGALLEQLGLAGRLIVVERNGEPVPRAAVAATVLADGDRLELVRAVAGG